MSSVTWLYAAVVWHLGIVDPSLDALMSITGILPLSRSCARSYHPWSGCGSVSRVQHRQTQERRKSKGQFKSMYECCTFLDRCLAGHLALTHVQHLFPWSTLRPKRGHFALTNVQHLFSWSTLRPKCLFSWSTLRPI